MQTDEDCNLVVRPRTQQASHKQGQLSPTYLCIRTCSAIACATNQAFQSVSWLCCISRHFVRSAPGVCTAKHLQPRCSCITSTSFHSSVPEERNNIKYCDTMATTSGFQFCTFVVTEVLHRTQTLSFTSFKDFKSVPPCEIIWTFQVSCTLPILTNRKKSYLFARKALVLATTIKTFGNRSQI